MSGTVDERTHHTSWGREQLRGIGTKGVVAVVGDTTAEMLRKAAGAGATHGWGDSGTVADPGADGLARVLTSRTYQDLIGLFSDLMIFDSAVADEEAWDVLCDYFRTCGAAGERLLLIRPLPLPADLPEESVTVIVAPRELTAEFLREQIVAAPMG